MHGTRCILLARMRDLTRLEHLLEGDFWHVILNDSSVILPLKKENTVLFKEKTLHGPSSWIINVRIIERQAERWTLEEEMYTWGEQKLHQQNPSYDERDLRLARADFRAWSLTRSKKKKQGLQAETPPGWKFSHPSPPPKKKKQKKKEKRREMASCPLAPQKTPVIKREEQCLDTTWPDFSSVAFNIRPKLSIMTDIYFLSMIWKHC